MKPFTYDHLTFNRKILSGIHTTIQYVAHPDLRGKNSEVTVRKNLKRASVTVEPNDSVELKLIVTADRVQGIAGDMNNLRRMFPA